MKIRALVSFSGALSMYAGEVREYGDKAILSDLLQAGHIEEVKTVKDVKSSESKRNTRK